MFQEIEEDSVIRERIVTAYKDSHPHVVFIDKHFKSITDRPKMREIQDWLNARWEMKHYSKCEKVHNPHHEDYPDVIHSIDDDFYNVRYMCVWFRHPEHAMEFKLTWG